jgi:hypothetical protein
MHLCTCRKVEELGHAFEAALSKTKRNITCTRPPCQTTCMSYEEEDTCISYEEEDTCMSYEEEDTFTATLSDDMQKISKGEQLTETMMQDWPKQAIALHTSSAYDMHPPLHMTCMYPPPHMQEWPKQAIALHTHNGQYLDELSFSKNDILTITGPHVDAGW